jgi:metacaspase-1
MATKAFLVGINDYALAGPGGPDLNGCVNDVKDMANTLVICGFPSSAIRICTNRSATKAGILLGLKWLLERPKPGDSLVFYYSGHGSQVTDPHGDEADCKDEILCPHDINFSTRIYISDDDLRSLFSTLPAGVNLEVILDSCHSGTGTRELKVMEMMPKDEKLTARYFEPPVDVKFHLEYGQTLKRRRILRAVEGAREIVIAAGLNHSLWAACRDYQTSTETNVGDSVRGVFTYNFCQVLRRTHGNIKRKDLETMVSAALARSGYAQVPQLETARPELLEKPFQ